MICLYCDKPGVGRQMCRRHYSRWFRGMNPQGPSRNDPNEIRVNGDIAEMDLYDRNHAVVATALFDAVDLPKVQTRSRWGILRKRGRGAYVVARTWVDGKNQSVYLHRLLTDCPSDLVVDHANGDGLDNRQSNLRICTHTENLRNRAGTSDHRKGVYLANGRWQATMSLSFDTYAEAVAQREAWEIEFHGEFRYQGAAA